MAARIRLKRIGRKGQPAYRIVVLDGRTPRDTKVVADLGYYNPRTDPSSFEIDPEATLNWLQEGAKATATVRSIISKAGIFASWHNKNKQDAGKSTTEEDSLQEESPVAAEE
ncbi:30S ribosomal protein S16 [Candidatus Acetothermia bacterium]|nr:30S ribosomal protein S16 [Candidatus Acetothermia bacterium]